MANELNDLVRQFGLPENPGTGPIPKESVTSWMRSENIDVLGALYAFIGNPDNFNRITPGLSLPDHFEFVLSYFKRCLLENPGGEWAHSRYEAAWEFASWFCGMWKDNSVERERFEVLRKFLAEIYANGDDTVRDCIVNGALEHMFENRDVARYFECWRTDSDLAVAYKDALLWRKKGGASELS